MRGKVTRWMIWSETDCELWLTSGEARRTPERGGSGSLSRPSQSDWFSTHVRPCALLDPPSCLLTFLHFFLGLKRQSQSTLYRPPSRPRISSLRNHPPIELSAWGFFKTKAHKSPLRTILSNISTSKELPVTTDPVLNPPPARCDAGERRSSGYWTPGGAWFGKRVRRLAAVSV